MARRKFFNNRGSATVLAILTMLLLLAGSGTYYVSATAGLDSTSGFTYAQTAHYAAEAGVRYALAHATNYTDDNFIWEVSGGSGVNIPSGSPMKLNSGSSDIASYWVTVAPDTLPVSIAGLSGHYFKVTSTGKALSNNTQRTIVVYLSIGVPPGTIDLVRNGIFSGETWGLGHNSDGVLAAKAPSDDNFYQVLFKDYVYANNSAHVDVKGDKGFTLNYNMNMKSWLDGHGDTDTGFGIYYMVDQTIAPSDVDTRNPNNMSAYVLQYDPGLVPNQILVKKVQKSYASTTTAWNNERRLGTDQQWGSSNNYNNDSFQVTANPGDLKWNATPDAEGIYRLKNNLAANTATNPTDQMIAAWDTEVAPKLASIGKSSELLNVNHQLTVDVRPDASGKVVHSISIDGLEVLKFIDRSSNSNYKVPSETTCDSRGRNCHTTNAYDASLGSVYTQGGTGLRVWNADVEFYGTSTSSYGPIIASWGYKPL